MTYQIAVVTAVDEEHVGNLACDFDIYQMIEAPNESNDYLGRAARIDPMISLTLRTPVFHRGEILILNDIGREVGYPGRKPDKWDVKVEFVANLEQADALVESLMED